MKKKISFNMWISVFFGGIWQFICSVFFWKNKTPFWRVIGAVVTICILAFTSMLGYAFYDDFYGRYHRYDDYYATQNLGGNYNFYRENSGKGKSYICERTSGKKVLTGLDWIARSADGDSLIVFARDGKRGFFNRLSGKTAIPAIFDAAWCFNDGVAGVCIGDSVFFIDHQGNRIYSRRFASVPGRSYTYHGSYFAFADNGKIGLADRSGNTVVPAVYDDIIPMANRMWNVKADGKTGTANSEGQLIIPCEYKDIFIYPEGGIVVMADDNSKKRTDYNGTVTDDFVYDYTYTMDYLSDETDKEGNRIQKPANLFAYSCNGHYGLIDRKGRPVTPPIYSSITAYSADLFECQIDNGGEYLIINEKGEKTTD